MVEEQRVVREERAVPAAAPTPPDTPRTVIHETVASETVRRRPSGAEVARRVVVFVFGVIQALIVIRIVLLLVNANPGNGLVRGIYDLSTIFIAPFEGVLHTNAISAGASVLDIAALVALVGWTILEFILIALVNVARREP